VAEIAYRLVGGTGEPVLRWYAHGGGPAPTADEEVPVDRPDFAAPDVRELRRRVALTCRILYQQGLADYLGHPSARIGESGYVVVKPKFSPRIKGFGAMTTDNMLVVDLDGHTHVGDDPPPSELSLHLEIYRARPDVKAIVHTHQLMSTLFGVVDRPILPLLHLEGPLVADGIALYPSAKLITTPERGREMAQALGNHALMHLQGHGIVTTGPRIEEAAIAAIMLERLAHANYLAATLGTPRVIPPDEIALLRAESQPPEGRWAFYSSLVEEPT
jgi:ribulose-5-phosphate 4-epimerase/fuculose-1-phosphate aldolase